MYASSPTYPDPCLKAPADYVVSRLPRLDLNLLQSRDMSKTRFPILMAAMLMFVWGRGGSGEADVSPGAEVTVEMPDGSLVTGRVAAPPSRAPEVDVPVQTNPQFTEITLPVGTTLALALDHELASDVSQVEDAVRAQLTRPVMVDDTIAIPHREHGHRNCYDRRGVREGARSGDTGVRFDHLDIDSHRYDIRSDTVSYQAKGTKTRDAKKIGIGAGAGAVIGGLLGGKKGAGTGAVIGGGAGTAMVLTTAGNEVELRPGTTIDVSLSQPLTLLIPMS